MHTRPLFAVVACALLASPSAAQSRPPRVFAPGVETVIASQLDPQETTSRHDLIEVVQRDDLEWTPALHGQSKTLHSMAQDALFTRALWRLEFAFKPLRMIRLEATDTESEPRLIWYLVYRVKNTGDALKPVASEDSGAYEGSVEPSGPIRFSPHFVLQGHDVGPEGGKLYRSYLDRVAPGAVEPIRMREVPGRRLLTSVDMPLEPIEPGQEAWGVAMWKEIDPEMDFFSVYVRGLTNAYRWTDPPGAYSAGDPPGTGREFAHKTLQLNFWRPGDRFMQHESEVRYGVPPGKAALYGVDEGVAHKWVYR